MSEGRTARRIPAEIVDLSAEWLIARVGDAFEIQQGKALSPRAKQGVSPKPFLRTSNVLWGRLDLSSVDEMDFSPDEIARLSLQPGDLLVCEGGDVGRTAMWDGELAECYYQNHLHRLRPKSADVEPRFFMFWMQAAHTLLGLYGGQANRTTIPNLSKSRLANFPVPFPPLPEQRSIAWILSAVRLAMEETEDVIGAGQAVKDALQRRLFTVGVKRPEPVPAADTVDAIADSIPAGWTVSSLGAIASIRYGLGQPPPSSADGIPMIRATNIKRGRIVTTGLVRVGQEDLPLGRDPYLKAGDVIVVRSGAYTGDVALITEEWNGAVAGYDLVVTPSTALHPPFCAQYLLGPRAQGYFRSQRDRSAQPHINAQQLAATPVPVPPLPVQMQVAGILNAIDAKVDVEENRRAAIADLFNSLLHSLMAGRLPTTFGGIE